MDNLTRFRGPKSDDPKPHHPLEQHVSQAAQHPLARHADLDIHQPFQPVDGDDQEQVKAAQQQQIGDLLELQPDIFLGEVGTRDCLVDDDFGDFQTGVDQRKGRDRQC